MKNNRYFIFLFMLLASITAMAQNYLVKGKVLDEKDESLIGATIQEVGNAGNGTVTDLDGNFELKLKNKSAKLQISYIGYATQTVNAVYGKQVLVQMKSDSETLEEVVVVGFGTQKKITSTGAVSGLAGEKIKSLKSVPASNVNNALGGRLPGLFTQQRSGEPGNDQADMFIRGVNSLNGDSKPLIIVDDVEYDYQQFAQLNANEIETISILKDASTTAIYGLKGANGVIVVTTTRGQEGKPQIGVTVEGGFNQVIQRPVLMDSYTSAMLLNEAVMNDAYGSGTVPTLPFSAYDLEMFRNGSNPLLYPNVDWYSKLLRNRAPSSRYNIDVRGGNKIVKYYTSLGFFNQGGIMRHLEPTKPDDDADNNYYYNRINFRSNLDITPTSTTKIRLDVNGRFETKNNPLGSVDGGVFQETQIYKSIAPFAMPVVNPDGTYGYNTYYKSTDYVNPMSRYANSGYSRQYKNNFQIVAGIDQKLDFITKGLSIKGNMSYAGNFNEKRELKRDPKVLPAWHYNEDGTYTMRNSAQGLIPPYGLTQSNSAFNYTMILQAMLNYNRTFSGHHVYGLLLLNQRTYVNGANLKVNYRGTTVRLGYDYKQRYLFEFNLARNGNDQFRAGERFGIFPAASIGWNIAEENFFKEALPFVDMFKLRGSYGLVGSDTSFSGTVDEEISYTEGSNWYGNTIFEGSLVNPFVTWEKERKFDVGVDLALFNNHLSITADYFYNYRYDQLIGAGDVPSFIGQGLPKYNMGETSNRGFDGNITYRNRIGKDFDYSVSLNFSHAKNKIEYVSEAPDYPYQARTGTVINSFYGFHCLGFYQMEDFDENGDLKKGVPSPTWANVQPGDLKYADMNNDGFITDADKMYQPNIKNLPETVYGLNMGMSYKGFSLELLWQGAFDYYFQFQGGIDAFDSNMKPWHLERWTPATAYTATFPRLSMNNKHNSSYQTVSDFWSIDSWYLRLKSLNIGYQLPDKVLKRYCPFVNKLKVYMVGYNLFTFHNLGKYNVDPEYSTKGYNAYPTTANYTFGIQLGF